MSKSWENEVTFPVLTERELGPHGVQEKMLNKQGLEIAVYYWRSPSPTPKGTVVLLHGHGSYLLYDWNCNDPQGQPGDLKQHEGSWIQEFIRQGYSVAGIDHQSMGWSQGLHGLRGFLTCFQDLVDDVLQFLRTLDGKPGFGGGLPKFLVACSMGGCVAVTVAHTLQDSDTPLAGIALLAPMLSLEKVSKKGLNPYLRPIATALSYWVPTAQLASTAKNDKYPQLQLLFEKDPLTYTAKTRCRVAVEYLHQCESLTHHLIPKLHVPFITFHSENDDMVDPLSSKLLYLEAATQDKQLVLCNDSCQLIPSADRHILQHEADNRHILAKIVAWITERAATPLSDSAASVGAAAPRRATASKLQGNVVAESSEGDDLLSSELAGGKGVRMGERAVLRVGQRGGN